MGISLSFSGYFQYLPPEIQEHIRRFLLLDDEYIWMSILWRRQKCLLARRAYKHVGYQVVRNFYNIHPLDRLVFRLPQLTKFILYFHVRNNWVINFDILERFLVFAEGSTYGQLNCVQLMRRRVCRAGEAFISANIGESISFTTELYSKTKQRVKMNIWTVEDLMILHRRFDLMRNWFKPESIMKHGGTRDSESVREDNEKILTQLIEIANKYNYSTDELAKLERVICSNHTV